MGYTRVNWKDGSGNPGGDTPLDAANLNQMDLGISNAVANDGTSTMTAALKTALALGGANKVVLDLNATDGKHYQFLIRTDGAIVLWDATDSRNVALWYPAGISTNLVYDGGLGTIREVRRFFGTADPSTYATMQECDEWVKV
jgi:hypothetical protein